MSRLKKMRLPIDDPEFAARCLDFMPKSRFDEVFYIKKECISSFIAILLTKDYQLDVMPYDEIIMNKGKTNTRRKGWKW